MAEFVMKKKVADMAADSSSALCRAVLAASDFEIASAATSTEEIGNPVYPPARRLLNARGISCDGHTARQMNQSDYDYYDYIVLMDRNNLRNLRWNIDADCYRFETAQGSRSEGRKKISLIMDWTSRPGDVADPWYTGNFDAPWKDVNEGCDGLLDFIITSRK